MLVELPRYFIEEVRLKDSTSNIHLKFCALVNSEDFSSGLSLQFYITLGFHDFNRA